MDVGRTLALNADGPTSTRCPSHMVASMSKLQYTNWDTQLVLSMNKSDPTGTNM